MDTTGRRSPSPARTVCAHRTRLKRDVKLSPSLNSKIAINCHYHHFIYRTIIATWLWFVVMNDRVSRIYMTNINVNTFHRSDPDSIVDILYGTIFSNVLLSFIVTLIKLWLTVSIQHVMLSCILYYINHRCRFDNSGMSY